MYRELIEKLKKNERAFKFLSDEEKVILRDPNVPRIYMTYYGRFMPHDVTKINDGYVYRIHDDYHPAKDVADV